MPLKSKGSDSSNGMPWFKDMVSKEWYQDEKAVVVKLSNNRCAWVSNSPNRVGVVNYSWAKKCDYLQQESSETSQ